MVPFLALNLYRNVHFYISHSELCCVGGKRDSGVFPAVEAVVLHKHGFWWNRFKMKFFFPTSITESWKKCHLLSEERMRLAETVNGVAG